MKGTDKAIFMGMGVVALALLFYFMILAPKRQQASDLQDQVSQLEASVAQENQVAAFGEQARQDFPRYYGSLVVLGKAVPEQADTASMMVQLNSIAGHTGVAFRGLTLGTGTGAAGTGSSTSSAAGNPAAAPANATASSGTSGSTTTGGSSGAPTSTTGTTQATPASSTSSSSAAAGSSTSAPASAVPATEADAASQPIGAEVGPAGLPTLPYELTFRGGFFNVADFIGGVDELVQMHHGTSQVAANGRLMTVDGFALKGGQPGADPTLDASFLVTSYVTPAVQGLTAGATPGGPAPVSPTGQAPTTPVSGSVGR